MATDSSGVSQTLTKYIKSEPSFATLLADIERLEWGQLDEHDHLHFKHAERKKIGCRRLARICQLSTHSRNQL